MNWLIGWLIVVIIGRFVIRKTFSKRGLVEGKIRQDYTYYMWFWPIWLVLLPLEHIIKYIHSRFEYVLVLMLMVLIILSTR